MVWVQYLICTRTLVLSFETAPWEKPSEIFFILCSSFDFDKRQIGSPNSRVLVLPSSYTTSAEFRLTEPDPDVLFCDL